MNNIILDTHVFIWLLNGDVTLPPKVRKIIGEHLSEGAVYLSAISCWEIAMLERAGRIRLSKSIHNWIEDALSAPGFILAPLTTGIAIESCNLPGDFHGDPADRIIVATARVEGARLVTSDNRIRAYARQGHVNVEPK